MASSRAWVACAVCARAWLERRLDLLHLQRGGVAQLARAGGGRKLALIGGDFRIALARIALRHQPGDPEILERERGLMARIAQPVLRRIHARGANPAVGVRFAGQANAAADAGGPFVQPSLQVGGAGDIFAVKGEFVRSRVARPRFRLRGREHRPRAAHARDPGSTCPRPGPRAAGS